MEPKTEYKEEFVHEGHNYKMVIKSYDEPFKKNDRVDLYTRVEVFKEVEVSGEKSWKMCGHMNFEQPWSMTDCEKTAPSIKKHINVYLDETD